MSALSAKDDEVPFDSGLAVSIACITLNVIAKIGQRRRRLLALSKRLMQSPGHRLPGVKLTLPRQVQDLSG
jgi:hypothetical protein